MRILSLFDGMACGMLAMQGAGIKVDRYVAFEIDKHAVKTSSHNFTIIEHRGDVFQADFTEFCGFDFLIGGSPCTYWSIAQKNNRETVASGIGWELFSQYVRALHEAQPRYFIYENNKSMSKAIRESITQAFGFEPICINSALVSAQNRQRLYWVGRRNPDGTYSRVKVVQPKDRGILLQDVLDGIKGPVACRCRGRKDKDGNSFAKYECREDGKANTIDTNTTNGSMVAVPVAINTTADGKKARTLMAGYYKYGTATLITNKGFTGGTTAVAEPVNTTAEGKAQCLRATYYKDGIRNLVANDVDRRTCVAEPILVGDAPVKAVSCPDGKVYPVYEVKDGQITINGKQYPIKLADGFYIIRKLTVRECKRLQTVPEWYVFPVSDTQAYKLLGNGWTVEVIIHLIKAILFECI